MSRLLLNNSVNITSNNLLNTALRVVNKTFNPSRDLTFRGPCIVIYSYNKTNEMH
jgi:hypothetical protein